MQPYYTAVRNMLRPAPAPEHWPRTTTFVDAVAGAGLPDAEYPAGVAIGAAALFATTY
jgi:hypothetical protein